MTSASDPEIPKMYRDTSTASPTKSESWQSPQHAQFAFVMNVRCCFTHSGCGTLLMHCWARAGVGRKKEVTSANIAIDVIDRAHAHSVIARPEPKQSRSLTDPLAMVAGIASSLRLLAMTGICSAEPSEPPTTFVQSSVQPAATPASRPHA